MSDGPEAGLPLSLGNKTYAKVRLPREVPLGRLDREGAGGRP
jgi:hypothetical protein